MPREWDATAYERLSAPLEAMGREVLQRLELEGDETVLDAGCGTGRVTAAIAERLPRGHVIAVDGSRAMVEQARARLPETVDVREADLVDFELEAPVDAVISTATFHWIGDHPRLFARLHDALKPGGRLVAQCGGAGNVEEIKQAGFDVALEAPYGEHLAGWPGDWNFATPRETEQRLREAGFTDVWCWSTRLDVDIDDPEGYLATICLGSFLERLPAGLHERFVADAVARLGVPLTIHYVRLNMLARRAPV